MDRSKISLMPLAIDLEKYKRSLWKIKREYQTAREISRVEHRRAIDAKRENAALNEAGQILLAAAEKIQNEVHQKLAGIVTQCLAVVFPDPYEFKIEFVQRRGKTEADLYFVRKGRRRSPLRATGGGVTDVASFVLRVASLMQRRPRPRQTIIADEPFKNVSKEYVPRVKQMLEMLSSDLDFQFVIVTHLKELNDVGT